MSELPPEDQAFLDRFKRWKHRPKATGRGADPSRAPQEVYADLMKNVFAPALRQSGLKGSGGRFELPSETHWALLGFQKSAYSDAVEVQFTVNLSAIGRDVWAVQAASSPHLGAKPSPTTFYGKWADQVRIGSLTPTGEDLWWSLRRGEDTRAVSDTVVSALLDLAVPWLVTKANSR